MTGHGATLDSSSTGNAGTPEDEESRWGQAESRFDRTEAIPERCSEGTVRRSSDAYRAERCLNRVRSRSPLALSYLSSNFGEEHAVTDAVEAIARAIPRPEEEPSPARIEAFSDGVFAIIITLLVLDLRVPREDALGGQSLDAALMRQWPLYAAYVLSFLQVGVVWANHHTMFHYMSDVSTCGTE
ncbi:TMEM175 family protein [Methylobacterium sp. HMF5984]|uniref:TMEM175 family protein n=1 Tax=Methylobacterium sp. HMF5984 TaxID=3367370 RepID=UPI00385377BC